MRQSATVQEALLLAGKLHHASFLVRPGRYFVRRLLQRSNLQLNGAERDGGRGGVGQVQDDVMAIVMTAFVMILWRGERPRRRREAVLVRAHNEAA